ncbi:MAG: hypothetical protein QOK07_1439 [Gemmatimonadaceae bacterium]|nr:hypothetical protein [Gemmatimonadaceae bacterium]
MELATLSSSEPTFAHVFACKTDTPDTDIGQQVLRLLETSPTWVMRRLERVVFLDAVAYRKTVTITFTVPATPSADPAAPPTAPLLPLAMLSRRLHADLTVRNERGNPAPFLTRQWNHWVAWSVLVAAAGGVLNRTLQQTAINLDADIIDRLRTVATADWKTANKARQDLLTEANRILAEDPAAASKRQLPLLINDDAFCRLLTDFSRNWLVLIATPERGPTHVWTFGYVAHLRWGRPEGRTTDEYSSVFRPPYAAKAKGSNTALLRWLQEVKWRQMLRMGWTHRQVAFPTPSLASCSSLHFQIESPPGLYVLDVRLVYYRVDETHPEAPYTGVTGGHWGHVHSAGIPFARKVKAEVEMVPIPRGLIRHGALAGLVSATVLTVCLIFLARFQSGPPTTAAILLAVPSIILGVLARPDEHELSSLMHTGVKFWVFVSALCLYGSALGLLVRLHPIALFWIWSLFTTVAWVSAWFLAKSYFTPRRCLRRGRPHHNDERRVDGGEETYADAK